MKKVMICFFPLLFLSSILLVMFAKKNIKHLDYDEYYKTNLYNFFYSEKSSVSEDDLSRDWTYESMFLLEHFFLDDEDASYQYLFDNSEAVLVVSSKGTPEFKGRGIVNDCIINKVMKGDFDVGDTIRVYDLVVMWNKNSTSYLSGTTPMQVSKEYLVFLKQTKHANVNDAYVFTSVRYGKISLNGKLEFLEDYEMNQAPICEIIKYDLVFSKYEEKSSIKSVKKTMEKIRKSWQDESI